MSDVVDNLYTSLITLKYPVKEHGSFQDGEKLPDGFITYQLLRSPDVAHYDNKPTATDFHFQLTFYTKKPSLKQGANKMFKDLLLPLKYRRNGGRFLPIDPKTFHHGYVTEYRIIADE